MPHEGRQRALGRTIWIGKPCRIGGWETSSQRQSLDESSGDSDRRPPGAGAGDVLGRAGRSGSLVSGGRDGAVAGWRQEMRRWHGWRHAFRWAPEQADAFVCRGDWRLEDQEFQKAIDDYNSALELDPAQILALLNRSQAFQHLGLHNEAIRDWKKLVELGAFGSRPPTGRAAERLGLRTGPGQRRAEGSPGEHHPGDQSCRRERRDARHTRLHPFLSQAISRLARPDLDLAVAGMEQEVKKRGAGAGLCRSPGI